MSDAAETASTPVLELDGARATIRLNRPKHLNRLQPDDLEALTASRPIPRSGC
jgi:enoyl-CoA hydratase